MKPSLVLAAIALAVAFSAQAQQKATAYQQIGLADLKVDIKSMVGKHVSTVALIQTMGEMNMLKSDPVDMAPVWAVADDLPRDDRKKLVSGCQVVLCGGTFYGTVRNGPIGPALRLERVEWK